MVMSIVGLMKAVISIVALTKAIWDDVDNSTDVDHNDFESRSKKWCIILFSPLSDV